jgi:hypothetical protein
MEEIAIQTASSTRRRTEITEDQLGVLSDMLPCVTDNLANTSGNWKVFISYSWDSEVHKAWVLSLANRLRGDGIDAILDQSHLELGGRTPEFMERSVRESRSVLVVCTEAYKNRFDRRIGGAGYEGHIITGGMIDSEGSNKFIPVLRSGNWVSAVPTALSGVYGVDLSNDLNVEYEKLVRHLHGVSNLSPVGHPPEWLYMPSTKPSTSIGIGATPNIKQAPAIVTPQEYWEERKRLPDSDLVNRIWQLPRWCIWSRPEEFKRARFRNLDHCREFIARAAVRSRGCWSQYPWLSATPEQGEESIADGIEITRNSIKHIERWALFRSGQFIDNAAFDEDPRLGNRTHALEILEMTTAVFELVGRMIDWRIISGRVAIAFEFFGVEGRQLTWPRDIFHDSDQVSADAWCQDDSITIDTLFDPDVLSNSRRALALNTALDIYAQFGWEDPPKQELEVEQHNRFGLPIRS